jgi:hypothetical protein
MPFKEEPSVLTQGTVSDPRPVHVPLRRCKVCRAQKAKADLQRWTLAHGALAADPNQIHPGRGYYTCSEKCADILPRILMRKK